MNLYTFEPYKWDYCGGCIVVIAKSFKEAVKLINTKMKEDHIKEKWAFEFEPHMFLKKGQEKNNTIDNTWIVTHSIRLSNTQMHIPRVLVENYNYAYGGLIRL